MTSLFQTFPESEVMFNYVPKKYLNSSIRLVSTTDQPLAFKIKTNVPICYLVKPHIGYLPPRSTIDISITMQPTDYNPQTAAISDKFLINIVPLSPNTDATALADPARFQQIWDSVPKNLQQANKLKVVLKFEDSSANTSVLDKSDDDAFKSIVGDSDSKDKKLNDSGLHEKSSMMYSFTKESPNVGATRNLGVDQNLLPNTLSDQVLTASQKQNPPVIKETKEEEKEQKREVAPAKGEISTDSKGLPKSILERADILERRISEMENEKRILDRKCQELTGKAEGQQRLLLDLSEENTKLKSELSNLKSSAFAVQSKAKEKQNDADGYHLWHLLLASAIALILGAYLSSS